MFKLSGQLSKILGFGIILAAFGLINFTGWKTVLAAQPDTGVSWDTVMQIPSPEESRSWFPDLAVDSHGNVHVVWNETKTEKDRDIERVFYSMWDGDQWLPYNDIVAPQPDIIRNSIAIDSFDRLHLIYGWFGLHYKSVEATEAWSAAAWSTPRTANSRGGSYTSDVTVYENSVYVVYDDKGAVNEDSPCLSGCADMFFRASPDLGRTWQKPVPLYPTNGGSARGQIEVDPAGVIHVSWDEGWDRFSGVSSPNQYGIYMNSKDGGATWSEPTFVNYPTQSNFQLSVGADGKGGVLLVWRTNSNDYPGIYYMWSTNYGESWSPPQTIPGILSRGDTSPFDGYDMTTDSAGTIHLVLSGKVPLPSDGLDVPGLYHLQWEGQTWSAPVPLYHGTWLPEYPHIVVNQGNQLYVTWFLRKNLMEIIEPHQIWFAHGQSTAPHQEFTVKAAPSPTLTPTTPATPPPTATPQPTLAPDINNFSVSTDELNSIYTEDDDLLLLLKSLLPVVLVLGVVIGVTRFMRR